VWKEGGYYQVGFNHGFIGVARCLPSDPVDKQQYRTGYQDGTTRAKRRQPLVRMLQAVMKGNKMLEV